jgi:flagella basal body P-ring formation protein FlgA
MNFLRTAIVAALILLGCDFALGAELRLKPQARCSTGVVRLGDVAEIHAAESWQREQLAAIELGPAPATGGRRYIRAREVQDALWMRGVNLAAHQLSGSERIEVIGPGEPVADSATTSVRIDEAARVRARRQVAEAIAACLQRQTGSREPWQVAAQLNDAEIASLGVARRVTADGGAAPWTGPQRFQLTIEGATTSRSLTVEADVTLPPSVVAAVRNLSAGAIMHESDLVLKPMASLAPGAQVFYRLEDVVGQQTAHPIAAGAVLGQASVRRPIVVRRGDAVTLYSRAAGLRVRTTVRAREDGGLGDLVAVESLTNREAFYARVTGIQEAEVYAAPAAAATPAPAGEAALGDPRTQGGIVR